MDSESESEWELELSGSEESESEKKARGNQKRSSASLEDLQAPVHWGGNELLYLGWLASRVLNKQAAARDSSGGVARYYLGGGSY